MTIIEDAVENAFRPEFGDRPDIPNHVIFVMNTISSDREIIEEVDNLVEASDALKAKVEEVSENLLSLHYATAWYMSHGSINEQPLV